MSLNDVFTSTQTIVLRDGVCQNLSFQNIFGGEFLHGEPCFRLDISAYMLNKIRDLLTYSAIKWV